MKAKNLSPFGTNEVPSFESNWRRVSVLFRLCPAIASGPDIIYRMMTKKVNDGALIFEDQVQPVERAWLCFG